MNRRCESCLHFEDFRSIEDEPGEVNGYCAVLVNTYGLERAVKMNGGYAGRWVHHESSCNQWQASRPGLLEGG